MTKTMQKLIDTVAALPEQEQDSYAVSWLEDLKWEKEWEKTFALPESQTWMVKEAEKATKAFKSGLTKPMPLNQSE